MESKTIVIRFNLTRQNILAGLTFLFLVWRPGWLGSETITLTTYYPAPYGGYVSLLTTGGTAGSPRNTLLARDAGAVGIGGTPGGAVGGNNQVAKLELLTGALVLPGSGTLYARGRMHIAGTELLYVLNSSGLRVSKAWGGTGDLTVEGRLNNVCVRRNYSFGGTTSCPASHPMLIGHGGSQPWTGYWTYPIKSVVGTRNSYDPNGSYWTWDLSGNNVYYNYLDSDWGGWITCCNMDAPFV